MKVGLVREEARLDRRSQLGLEQRLGGIATPPPASQAGRQAGRACGIRGEPRHDKLAGSWPQLSISNG